jgi:hypothetical protein
MAALVLRWHPGLFADSGNVLDRLHVDGDAVLLKVLGMAFTTGAPLILVECSV